MAKSPAFQFYPKDWLSSQKILLMTPAEEGAYIRLLCYCWDDEDCSIPDDDEVLARISRLGEEWLKGGSSTLRRCFMPHPTKVGFLSNQRLLDEREKQKIWREKSQLGGKNSAEARRRNSLEKVDKKLKGGSTTLPRVVEGWLNTASASASTSAFAEKKSKDVKSTSLPKEKNFSGDVPQQEQAERKSVKSVLLVPPWLKQTDWEDFVEHRRALRKPMSVNAQHRLFGALSRLRDAGQDPSAVINQSIENGWAGVFPLRGQNGGMNAARRESSAERFSRINSEAIRRCEEAERIERERVEKDITPVGQDAQSFPGLPSDLFAEVDKPDHS